MNQTKNKTCRRACIYEGGSRGGCINQEDLDAVLTRCFDHEDFSASVQLKASAAAKSLSEYIRDVSYTIRVMLAHIRIKFEAYSGLEDQKKSRDPPELLDIYSHIKVPKKATTQVRLRELQGGVIGI